MGGESRLWRARDVEWEIRRTLVMGIVNVTPDSFSDGGEHATAGAAVAYALRLADEGADLLDIGGESTRPGAQAVDAGEEWRRIGVVIQDIARKSDVPISVDTYKPDIARKAIRAGAVIVNDVRGLRSPEMTKVVANSGAGAVIMHMQGEPATMNLDPRYTDVVREVRDFLARQLDVATRAGVERETIALDPGFGFGKTPAHNTELLRGIAEIRSLGRPLLVGVSRKSFQDESRPRGGNRLEDSLAAAASAIERGADIVRVHDVADTVRFVRNLQGHSNSEGHA